MVSWCRVAAPTPWRIQHATAPARRGFCVGGRRSRQFGRAQRASRVQPRPSVRPISTRRPARLAEPGRLWLSRSAAGQPPGLALAEFIADCSKFDRWRRTDVVLRRRRSEHPTTCAGSRPEAFHLELDVLGHGGPATISALRRDPIAISSSRHDRRWVEHRRHSRRRRSSAFSRAVPPRADLEEEAATRARRRRHRGMLNFAEARRVFWHLRITAG